jgi:hypothetical protein
MIRVLLILASMFREARLKLERSNQHIHDFDSRCTEFLKSSAYAIAIKPDVETGDDFVEITAAQTMPDTLALILGDALHNLRSALDLAWFELTGADSPDPYKETFPIRNIRDYLEAFIKGRPKHHSLIALADTLLNVIQPYKGGNGHDLWCLNRLGVMDKHRLLIPHLQVLRLDAFFVENEHGEEHGINERFFSDKRPLILKQPGSGKLKVIKEGYCTATVVFGKGTTIPGRVILPTLRSFAVAVDRVLTILR